MSTADKTDNKTKVLVAIIAAMGLIIAALAGNQIIAARMLSTPIPTTTPLSDIDQILTSDAVREMIIATATQRAQMTATQQYANAFQTAVGGVVITQAQQDLATQQAQTAAAIAQLAIANQQTATAVESNSTLEKLDAFFVQAPGMQPNLVDGFTDDSNGWSPRKTQTFEVALNEQMSITVGNSYPTLPFIWTCDKCGPFSNFLMQVDITTPAGISNVYSGILFGSPTTLNQSIVPPTYQLLLNSSGAIYLRRISSQSDEIIQLWDRRTDVIIPDGKPRTLQIIGFDKYLSIYINGTNIVKALPLQESTNGYVGFAVSTARNIPIQFDNFKIVNMP